MAAAMKGYWTNMAKTGSPNGPGLVEWPKYAKADGYQHMQLADPIVVSSDFRNVTCDFWDSLPKEAPYTTK